MKKIIIICLAFLSLSARSEIIDMDKENPKENQLVVDEKGFYYYKRAEDTYKKNCQDSSTEEIRKKCMMAEQAAWERGKTQDEINKQGTFFTGKIKVHSPKGEIYFYVQEGKKGEKINLSLNRYYFENGLLYDIKTETPFTGEIVIGGVEALSADENAPRYIAQQKYEDGLPVGKPELFLVEK